MDVNYSDTLLLLLLLLLCNVDTVARWALHIERISSCSSASPHAQVLFSSGGGSSGSGSGRSVE